jgi:hypothetical protein
MKRIMVASVLIFAALWVVAGQIAAQSVPVPQLVDLFNGKDLSGWVNVNTDPDTWSVQDGILVCKGTPIGVMRSEKQYENFVLHIEWRHMEDGGNSGVFVWSGAVPGERNRLPDGVEVQMLDSNWLKLRHAEGQSPSPGYISGELFGVGGVNVVPDYPRGERSSSVEMRVKPRGEWNTYDVVAVGGVIKLAINGKFVNGISGSTQRIGYLCLESEGSEIHFRNIKIMELPPGVTTVWQAAPLLD